MYYKKWKHIICLVLTAALFFSISPAASTMDRSYSGQQEGGCIRFSGLSALAVGESCQKTIVDAEGNELTIGIKRAAGTEPGKGQLRASSGEQVWQVWYSALVVRAEFYMTVSNDRVTSVYDDTISIVGGSYSNARLTKTSTYGKLSFTVTGVMGITSSSCWLKGTVTGENDEIEMTWQM